jgi:hypothetical protein
MFHARYILESLAVNDPAIFVDYVKWAQVLLTSLKLPKDCVSSSLEVFKDALRQELSADMSAKTDLYITEGILSLKSVSDEIPSLIDPDNPLVDVARVYLNALLIADRNKAKTPIVESLNTGNSIHDLYLHIFQPVLQEVGRL